MTPARKVAVGYALVVVGFLVYQGRYFPDPYSAVTAWALVFVGLNIVLFQRLEARIPAGIALVLMVPLLWFMLIFTPIFFFFFVAFFAAAAIALFGVFHIVAGLALKSREEVSVSPAEDRGAPLPRSPIVELLPRHTPTARVLIFVGLGILVVGFVITLASSGYPPYGIERLGRIFLSLIVMLFGLGLAAAAFFGGARPDEIQERRDPERGPWRPFK